MEKEQKGGRTNTHRWSPYYISVTVAFVFGALQAVHDRLDDPFDGIILVTSPVFNSVWR